MARVSANQQVIPCALLPVPFRLYLSFAWKDGGPPSSPYTAVRQPGRIRVKGAGHIFHFSSTRTKKNRHEVIGRVFLHKAIDNFPPASHTVARAILFYSIFPQFHAEHAHRVDAEWCADRSEDRSAPRGATDGGMVATTTGTAAGTAAAAAAAQTETAVAAAAGVAVGAASGCPSRQEAVASEEAFRVLRKASKKSAQVTYQANPPLPPRAKKLGPP